MFFRPRVIPCLLVKNKGLVKTVKFSSPRYLGDPINTVKIFNGKGVDELCILDIITTKEKVNPDFEYLKDIASEAFMPLSYGGRIGNLEQIKKILYIGYEKVVINSAFVKNPHFIKQASDYVGSQSIVVSIDAKKDYRGKYYCYINGGKEKTRYGPVDLALEAEKMGAGEILLNSINKDGTMQGYDLKLIKEVADAVSIPVIAVGGAKDINDLKNGISSGGAHAVSAGSMFVYYGKHKAVLVTFPEEKAFRDIGLFKE